jgi:putative tryptophan/tyrosine transport system substrate-binding protein
MGMRRREFIMLLGGAVTAWPPANAQQPTLPVIGFLGTGAPEAAVHFVSAFHSGLRQAGFVEAQNVRIEYRWANNQYDRLSELMEDLVRRQVAVIATPFSTVAAVAAKRANTTIPVVFSIAGDPIKLGLVASLNRPGGNMTGIVNMNVELGPKRLSLLHTLVPAGTTFALLVNPNNPYTATMVDNLQAAAAVMGVTAEAIAASTNSEIDEGFARIVERRVDGLLVSPDNLFSNRRVQIVTLCARHAIPTIYSFREDAEAGGLMSYGADIPGEYRDVGVYVGRILKSESPASLPVMQPTQFEFVINAQTAKTLGLQVPPALVTGADKLIE